MKENDLYEQIQMLEPNQAYRIQQILHGGPEVHDLINEYKHFYGPDPQSPPGWQPRDDFPHERSVSLPSAYAPEGQFNLSQQLRTYLFWTVLHFLQSGCLNGKEPIFEYLYNPSSETAGMEKASFFRKEIIWGPEYGSVKAFHDFLCNFIEDYNKPWYCIPSDLPPMKPEEVIAMFEREGDVDGAKLAKLAMTCYSVNYNILKWCRYITSNHYNDD